MGRNKFGPLRGPWADEEWKGWWGDEPPFHTPVFVMTHHERPSLTLIRRICDLFGLTVEAALRYLPEPELETLADPPLQ